MTPRAATRATFGRSASRRCQTAALMALAVAIAEASGPATLHAVDGVAQALGESPLPLRTASLPQWIFGRGGRCASGVCVWACRECCFAVVAVMVAATGARVPDWHGVAAVMTAAVAVGRWRWRRGSGGGGGGAAAPALSRRPAKH